MAATIPQGLRRYEKDRPEALSDGVIAIITTMMLEMIVLAVNVN
jgi:uncharacterized membrane protein